MKRTHLASVIALTGIALFALASKAVFASGEGPLPGGDVQCYYNGSFCSYPGTNYWSGCDTGFEPGMKSTTWAIKNCEEYHVS